MRVALELSFVTTLAPGTCVLGGAVMSDGKSVTLLVAHDSKKADDKPAAEITKTSGPITIDGVLDEPAWKNAKPIDVKAFPDQVRHYCETSPSEAK